MSVFVCAVCVLVVEQEGWSLREVVAVCVICAMRPAVQPYVCFTRSHRCFGCIFQAIATYTPHPPSPPPHAPHPSSSTPHPDITAKNTSQYIFASLFGTAAGVSCCAFIGQSAPLALLCFSGLAYTSLYSAYRTVKSIPLPTLNSTRLQLLAARWGGGLLVGGVVGGGGKANIVVEWLWFDRCVLCN